MQLRQCSPALSSDVLPPQLPPHAPDFLLIDCRGRRVDHSGPSLCGSGENQLPPPCEQTGSRLDTQRFPSLICSTGLHAAFMSVFCRITLPKHSLVPSAAFKEDETLGEVSQQEARVGPFTGRGALGCRWHPLYESGTSAAGLVRAGRGLFSAPPAPGHGCLLLCVRGYGC